MKKQWSKLIVVGLFILPVILFSQKETAKFVVKPVLYQIWPDDNYLFMGYRNKLKIIATKAGADFTVNISNGRLSKLNDSIYVVTNLSPLPTLISIVEKKPNGKTAIALNKAYTVLPVPVIKIAGVACDSAIGKLMLASGTFYAEFKNVGKRKVQSFKMDMYINKQFVQDSSFDGRLSAKMREYISALKGGNILYFKDLKYGGSDGIPKTEKMYRVFLIEDELNILSLEL